MDTKIYRNNSVTGWWFGICGITMVYGRYNEPNFDGDYNGS
jgi:hypothetical protein